MRNGIVTLLIGAALIQGCGTAPADRAVSGAGIGAGAGAVVGALTGMTVFEGAALGAAAGAITGAITNDRQVNLGSPAWKRGAAGPAPVERAAADDPPEAPRIASGMVADIQSGLTRLGYHPGAVDGKFGPRTRRAIRAFQRDRSLPVDGRATPELAAHIRNSTSL